jgi:hypothetical protein
MQKAPSGFGAFTGIGVVVQCCLIRSIAHRRFREVLWTIRGQNGRYLDRNSPEQKVFWDSEGRKGT